MTLDQALEILNREKHTGYDGWRRVHGPQCADADQDVTCEDFSNDDPYARHLSCFEAVAVAEKYERLRVENATSKGA